MDPGSGGVAIGHGLPAAIRAACPDVAIARGGPETPAPLPAVLWQPAGRQYGHTTDGVTDAVTAFYALQCRAQTAQEARSIADRVLDYLQAENLLTQILVRFDAPAARPHDSGGHVVHRLLIGVTPLHPET